MWRGPRTVVDLTPLKGKGGPGIPVGAVSLPPAGTLATPLRCRPLETLPGLGPDPDALEDSDDDGALGDFVLSQVAAAARGTCKNALQNIRHHALPGVNAPKVREYENDSTYNVCFGSMGEILDDLQDLGSTLLRQPSHADLLWPDDAVMPVCADGTDLYDKVFAGSAMITNAVAFLTEVVTRGTVPIVPPNASAINERLSWCVYQAFANLLCTVTSPPLAGQIVARWAGAAPSTTDYYRSYTDTDITVLGIVVHFMIATDSHYCLIMIDPCAAFTLTATCTLTTRRHHHADFYPHSIRPIRPDGRGCLAAPSIR